METSNSSRQPGWLFSSAADDLYYYYLAIDQSEAEVATLFKESDEMFFATLKVAVDELHVVPLAALRAWFEPRQESYPTRPVVRDGAAAWYRLVPRDDAQRGSGASGSARSSARSGADDGVAVSRQRFPQPCLGTGMLGASPRVSLELSACSGG